MNVVENDGGDEHGRYLCKGSDVENLGSDGDEDDWIKQVNTWIVHEDFVIYKNEDRGFRPAAPPI